MISYDTPIRFDLGIDGLPYAILPNEFEAMDYADYAVQGDNAPLYSFGGLFNAVLLQPTIGM